MPRVSAEGKRTSYTALMAQPEWPLDPRRYELYDGEVFVVPAPFPRHQQVIAKLFHRLLDYAEATGALALTSPLDIVFSNLDVVQPDIVVFTAARREQIDLRRAIRVAPDVAIEVRSDSTEANDRGRKLRMFERFGVPEYWIVDPEMERVDIRMRRDEGYGAPTVLSSRDTLTSQILSGFSCEVGPLFR